MLTTNGKWLAAVLAFIVVALLVGAAMHGLGLNGSGLVLVPLSLALAAAVLVYRKA